MKKKEYTISELDWLSMFGKLFSRGEESVIQTINGCLKKDAEKPFDIEIKKLFFEAAKRMFKGESIVDSNTIEKIKNLFKTNKILKELQEELNLDVFEGVINSSHNSSSDTNVIGETNNNEDSSSEDLDNL